MVGTRRCHMLSLTTVREQLNELFSFSIRVISLHDNIEWPTQSPDLNPYDFMRNKALVRRAVMYIRRPTEIFIQKGGRSVE